jgi:hypothetical protein
MDDVIVLQSAALTLEHGAKKRLEAVQVRRQMLATADFFASTLRSRGVKDSGA